MWKQTLQPEKGLFKHQSFRIELFRSKLLSYFKIPGLLTALIKNDSAKLEFRNWILNEIRIIFIEIENYLNPRNTLNLSPSKRYRVYSKAVAMIEENLASQLSIKQICDQIGTTPRTLQMSFKGLMGISPLQYISARRLHAVRQAFFKTPAKSISYIAQDYGLQHAGRLSKQYKRMFFELPSETLKRRV
jgi:AraC family ethanolamine operon transcriptional activator